MALERPRIEFEGRGVCETPHLFSLVSIPLTWCFTAVETLLFMTIAIDDLAGRRCGIEG